ncbi:hypothetical protein Taro_052987 [Colocasia esculenta]|uniref:Uncharacterized protein n=1 Tax=Colocasia esculenta TaxID=4460 RepID=A0A843XLP5_COLES|nr:hypothetical protein [Colocasia esculenta]
MLEETSVEQADLPMEGGWPLGLQPLNVRIGQVRNVDFSRSMSFSTLVSGSPTSSTDSSSSDVDTESTGSFFHDRSITLGRLIGITSILELSGGSFSSRRQRQDSVRSRKGGQKPRSWFFFSLCARTTVDGETVAADKAPSLGHFLAVERRASGSHRRNQVPVTYELVGVPESQPAAESEPNSLFSNGCIAPPRPPGVGGGTGEVLEPNEGAHSRDLCRHSNGYGIPLRLSCMGGCSLDSEGALCQQEELLDRFSH